MMEAWKAFSAQDDAKREVDAKTAKKKAEFNNYWSLYDANLDGEVTLLEMAGIRKAVEDSLETEKYFQHYATDPWDSTKVDQVLTYDRAFSVFEVDAEIKSKLDHVWM